MPAVAALLDTPAALQSLRRTLVPGPPAVVACRSPGGLERAYRSHLLDAVVLGTRALRDVDLASLHARYPAVPVLVYGTFRPDDGKLLRELGAARHVTAVIVAGVDDAVAGDLVRQHTLSRARASALADAPRLLRLTEDIQRRAWARLVAAAGLPVTTAEVAGWLRMSREHLSRQFGAGGAPNLKRVIDLLRVVCASELLASPGYDLRTVADLLRFSTVSHLEVTAKRITGGAASGLAVLGPRGVLGAFLRGGTRSRNR